MSRKWRNVEETIEDLTDLDSFAVGATEAAQRAGFPSAEAMERWLTNHKQYPLWLRFKGRDPEGAHEHQRARRLRMTENSNDTIAAVISKAQKSSRKRTRTKADKVSDLIAELRTTLATEEQEDTTREAARKEVDRLERELRDAKARMKGGATDDGPTPVEIRQWARAEGVDCPAKGRVPETVREAYLAASEQRAS